MSSNEEEYPGERMHAALYPPDQQTLLYVGILAGLLSAAISLLDHAVPIGGSTQLWEDEVARIREEYAQVLKEVKM